MNDFLLCLENVCIIMLQQDQNFQRTFLTLIGILNAFAEEASYIAQKE